MENRTPLIKAILTLVIIFLIIAGGRFLYVFVSNYIDYGRFVFETEKIEVPENNDETDFSPLDTLSVAPTIYIYGHVLQEQIDSIRNNIRHDTAMINQILANPEEPIFIHLDD